MPAEGDGGAPSRVPHGDPADHLVAIVESSDDAILSKDREARITSWNPAAERIYGYSAAEAVGQPIGMLVPEHRAGEEKRILERILRGEKVDHYETERVTKDGRALMVSLTVSPIRGPGGSIVGASVIARDITHRHRSRELAARLQEVTAALSPELTRDRVIEVVLEQAVAALAATAGTIAFVEGDEVVLAGMVGHGAGRLAGWERFPLAADVPMSEAIRSGEPNWTSTPEELVERFPALAGESIQYRSLAVLPLAAGGKPFGAISLSFEHERVFDTEERAFLSAASQQCAYALERARAYEVERVAADRQRFLAEAGELLSRSLDPEAALSRLADLAVDHIADWCGVELLDDGEPRSVAVAHVDPERLELARRLRERYPVDPSAKTGVPNVIRTGRSELHSEIPDELLASSARDEEHLRALRELGLGSAMIVPLRARGRVLGAITFVASDPARHYDESDLELAEDLARRAGLAVDNAMLFRREHEAALILQRSLLPRSLPRLPGMEFDARYEPAAAGFEVGGDWYEVVGVDDGTVGVTIGDVAGRGIRAASVMGRIRPALRAYVLDGHGPREAIERLDRMMKDFGGRREMTTVFHLHYDPARGTARYLRAGHPPALLRRPDGTVVEVAGRATAALGILDDIEYREHELELPHDSLLLLYTDGLIERPESDLRQGLERLKRAFAAAPARPRECLDWLGAQLRTDAMPDDVAMLAMSTGRTGAPD